MKKKVLSLFLAVLMIVSVIPMGTISASAINESDVKKKLDSFISSYPSGSRWTGTFDNGSQCYGFGKMVIFNLFGKNSSGGYRSWNYAGVSTSGMKTIGSVTSFSASNVQSLLSKAKCGDVLQFDQTKQHTMIVYSVDSGGVTVYDCNWDNNCGISKRYSSFGAWSGRNSAKLTLLRADNYNPDPTPNNCNCSTSYAGNYTCTTSSAPLTIRSGHGTSYSSIGSIPSGATVYVSKADGTWAHVTYNGVSGYASMEYLKKQGSGHAETPTIKWWVSDSEYGDTPSSFKQGNRYYLCYKLYDSVTGKDWNSVSSNNYKVKITFYYPDGSVFYSNEVANADNSWISSVFVKTGTFKYGVEISGDFTFSGSRTFTVNENPKKIYANTNSVDLKKGSTESVKIYVWTDGYCDKNTFLNWSASNSNITCVWGEWNNGKIPLTINANSVGSTELTLSVKENDSEKVLHSIKINVYIRTDPFYITYDANGGSPTFQDTTDQYGAYVFTSRQPTRTGYTFLGWHINKNSEKASAILEPGKKLQATEASTFYAVWKANTYTVKYNANGGSGNTASSSHTYDTAKALTANGFTRTGYIFAGWSTDSSATATQYGDEASVKNLTSTNGATVNLYARWKPIDYTVVYNANGGTGTMSNSNYTYDTAKALSVNKFTKDGYKFLGWSKSSTSTTPTYADGQSVKNLISTSGNVTLYAVWEKNPATVSSITVNTMPTKTVYTVGETFSSSGIVVKVNMSDGTSKTVTSGFTVSKPDMATAGTKTVTVTYEGKTATFNITVNKPVSPTSAKYKISGATATAGSTVEVYVSIENNPGIISLRNQMAYDTTALELIKVEDLKLLSGYTTPSPTIDSPYTLRWADSLATQNNKANGNFVKLTFKIKDDAEAGDYGISVSHIESRTATGEKVEFADCSAVITVIDYILGDIDGNGEVDDWDAIVLNRYLAGWQTEANLAAADMDGDGELTDWDAIALERRLAGWDV